MINNDQSTIIEAPEVYKSIPTHFPSKNQRQNVPGKNVDFDTFDGHVMVNYIEPNLQEIIFGPIRVGLITHKQFWDHLKNCHSWGRTQDPLALPPVHLGLVDCDEQSPTDDESDDKDKEFIKWNKPSHSDDYARCTNMFTARFQRKMRMNQSQVDEDRKESRVDFHSQRMKSLMTRRTNSHHTILSTINEKFTNSHTIHKNDEVPSASSIVAHTIHSTINEKVLIVMCQV